MEGQGRGGEGIRLLFKKILLLYKQHPNNILNEITKKYLLTKKQIILLANNKRKISLYHQATQGIRKLLLEILSLGQRIITLI